MPLDDFQKEILEVIRNNRTASSPFAGSAVIQQHGFRLTDDQDIFTAGDPEPVMRRDAQALKTEGFTVEETKSFEGFRECRVTKPGTGTAILQWAQALALEYFAPLPDPAFGHRLHFADLSANKTLAAAGRVAMRDFIDLWMLDRHVMPLWRMACAASGKFPQEAPLSLVEMISRNLVPAVARDTYEAKILTTADLPEGEPAAGLRAAIDKAREILPRMPGERLGKLQLDRRSQPMLSLEPVETREDSWIRPRPGGAMPAIEGMDGEMIAALVAEYGEHGSRYTG